MTRKDYIVIAEAVRVSRFAVKDRAVWEQVRDNIADVLAADNGRFDRDRFAAACENTRAETAA